MLHGGEYFSSGNDLSVFTKLMGAEDSEKRAFAETGVKEAMVVLMTALIDLEKPLVAVVRGASYGISCTMLGLADFIYCSPDGKFCTPFMDSF